MALHDLDVERLMCSRTAYSGTGIGKVLAGLENAVMQSARVCGAAAKLLVLTLVLPLALVELDDARVLCGSVAVGSGVLVTRDAFRLGEITVRRARASKAEQPGEYLVWSLVMWCLMCGALLVTSGMTLAGLVREGR